MTEFVNFNLSLRFHEDSVDLAALLRKLADRAESGVPMYRGVPVLDDNGNRIGTATLTDEL